MSLNLAECVAKSAQHYPDKTAIIFQETRLSYAILYSMVRRAASMLTALGIAPGDRVAIQLPNTPHFPIAYYGILHVGAVVVSLNPQLPRRELAHTLSKSGAKMLLVWSDFSDVATEVYEKRGELAPDLNQIVIVEPDTTPAKHAVGHSFVELMAQASDAAILYPTSPQDIAALLFTAATDGYTRAAALTHFNLYQNAETIIFKVLKYYPEDVFLSVLPLFHGFGQTTMMTAPFLAGSSIVLMPRFDASAALDLIAREGVTLSAMVPTMLHFLLASQRKAQAEIAHMRCLVVGGAAMDMELARQFEYELGVPVLEGYGLTETSPVVSFNTSPGTNRPGSVGKAIPGVEIRIVRDDGALASRGETGEIEVRGENVMSGYFDDPDGNEKSFDNGWFRTGDLGYLDEEECLFITGLKKDMILRAGMNVYAREVEMILEEHPLVVRAAVVGVPDRTRGHEVRAYVELRAESEDIERELGAHCRENLPQYKVPRKFEMVASLPLLTDGSIDKRALSAASA